MGKIERERNLSEIEREIERDLGGIEKESWGK